MNPKNDSLNNENGFSIISILLAVVIIGFLVHPQYSPFKEQYFRYTAKSDLQSLHRACRKFWAAHIVVDSTINAAMSADVFASRSRDKSNRSGDCTLKVVPEFPYSFKKSNNIEIEIQDGSENGFEATARHSLGGKMLRIDAGGNISE